MANDPYKLGELTIWNLSTDRFPVRAGGDSLYATAQWAMAKLDSRACRKLIAATIASYSNSQMSTRVDGGWWHGFYHCIAGFSIFKRELYGYKGPFV